jgi:hypothetical protein
MVWRLPVFLATVGILVLLSGRSLAREGRLEQLEKRVLRLEQREKQDVGILERAWSSLWPGFGVLAIAAFCALCARSTGRDPWLWLAGGLVFNIFALLAVWAKNEEDEKKRKEKAAEPVAPADRPREGGTKSQNVKPA